MKRLHFKPRKKAGLSSFIAILLLFLCFGTAALAFYLNVRQLYLLSFAFLALSIQVFTVYVISNYEYEIEDAFLKIYRVTGKKHSKIFDLDLNFVEKTLPYKEAKKELKSEKGVKRLYCTNGNARKNCTAIIYKTPNSKTALVIYADDVFVSAISKNP